MAGGHPTVGLYLGGLVVAGRSRRTIERRQWSLGLWVEHLERAGLALEAATVWDVEAFLARWPAAQSRQSIRSDLVQLYRWMVRRGLAGENPVELVDAPLFGTGDGGGRCGGARQLVTADVLQGLPEGRLPGLDLVESGGASVAGELGLGR